MDITSCISGSDADEYNNHEMKSCTKSAEDTNFNSPIKTRSTNRHKPSTKCENNQGKLKSVPTLNGKALTKSPSLRTSRSRSLQEGVNNCTCM